jgi:hypothetical protein
MLFWGSGGDLCTGVSQAIKKNPLEYCDRQCWVSVTFWTDPDADPRIREAQKHRYGSDPNPTADSERWYIYIILRR